MIINTYEDIFLHKTKKNKKILIKRWFCKDDIMFDKLKIVKDKNLKISTEDVEQKYDIVIFENLFYANENINEVINKYKNNNLIMFIERVTLSNKSWLNILKNCTGFNLEYTYIEDIFDILRQNDLKIIDNYRLESNSNYIITNEKFLITTILK